MRKLLPALGLLLCSCSLAFARDPASRLATPSFEDPYVAADMYAVNVGSGASVKLYTPNQNRDIRRIQTYNPSAASLMHISTWLINGYTTVVNSTVTQTTWVIPTSTNTGGYALDLMSKVTFYAIFETGASSMTVRTVELWNDQSKSR